MKSTFPGKWVLVILPLFYLILSFIFLKDIKYFYVGNFDPPYVYLLNGVNLANGHFRTGNIAHPGTPVEIFAAIVIFVKHLFAGNIILYQDVLKHPESYLFTCSMVLALLLALVTYFTGTYVFRHTGNTGLALLFQASPLFFTNTVNMAVSLSAESSLVICGIFFTAYLYINTIVGNQIPGKTTTHKNVILFGLFTALLFTTKIYCIPVVVLVFFMLKSGKQRIIYLISSGVFSLLLLFPLYNQFRNWAGSIKGMIFHSGAYGQGNAGIINAALYKNNIVDLFTTHYLFTAIYIFVAAAFLATLWGVLKKRPPAPHFILPIAGILLFFTIFILIIAKQYRITYPEPLTHEVVIITKYYYFIPLFMCFSFFIKVSYDILSPLLSFEFFRSYKQKLLYGVLLVFIILGGQKTYRVFYNMSNQNVTPDKTRQFLDQWESTPLIIVSDGDKACIEPALFLGISYSGRWDIPQYMAFVRKTYPNSYIYTTYDDALIFWDRAANIDTILKKNNQALVYLSGNDSIINTMLLKRICGEQSPTNKIDYQKIYSSGNRYENIYLIKTDSLR